MPRKSATENQLCHVHDKVKDQDVDDIRKNVCVNNESPIKFESKYYCLFHLPTKEKDIDKFEQILDNRLKDVEEKFAEIERLPEKERAKAKKSVRYDFRYVWFPSEVNFFDYKFVAATNFSSVTFTSYTNFTSAIFLAPVDFSAATFLSMTSFNSAVFTSPVEFSSATFTKSARTNFVSTTFLSRADFNSTSFLAPAELLSIFFSNSANFEGAIFGDNIKFYSAIFLGIANFSFATFSSYIDFRSVIFRSNVNFNSAKFEEHSQIIFSNMRFGSLVSFNETIFEGYVEFESDVFLESEKFERVRKELEKRLAGKESELARREIEFIVPEVVINQETVLNIQHARVKNPDRISFYSMHLRPNWFVNVDSRMFVFSEVEWKNIEIDIDKKGLDEEIENLEKRRIARKKEILTKTCNQLADNAEANRRFEVAKKFRKLSIALKEEKCHVHDSIDLERKRDIRYKVCRDYPVVNEDGGNYYCLWHNPDKNKSETFLEQFKLLQQKGYSDFRAVVFPITVEYLGGIKIVNDNDVIAVRIDLPTYLDFSHATFQRRLVLDTVNIHKLNLHNIYVEEDAEFIIENSTCDGEIDFNKAIFDGKLFLNGNKDYGFFVNPQKALKLNDARFGNPEWVNFRSIRLRPHYFIGVDASKFIFHDCIWKDENENQLNIKDEINLCSHKGLAQAANQIAINYEENRNFEDSTIFRYMAMQAKRFEYRLHGWFWTLNWLYWLSSGYGERRLRAGINLILVLVIFGLLYTTPLASFDYGARSTEKSGDAIEQQILCCANEGERFHAMSLGEGFVHSLSVASFLRPEPKSANTPTKFLVFLESILAPLQAALLALAIRRKFMR